MFRVDDATAVGVMPVAGAPGTPGYFRDGNPSGPTPSTIVPADWLNTIQEELLAVVVQGGGTPAKANNTQVRDAILAIVAAAGAPIGTVRMWPGTIAAMPALHLHCNGAAVSRVTYAALFAAIGTKFGIGDGVATFNLPDLRARVALGANNEGEVGTNVGANSVTATMQTAGAHTHGAATGATALTESQMPSHKHEITHSYTLQGEAGSSGHYLSKGTGSYINGTQDFDTSTKGAGATHNHSISSDGGHAHTMNAQDNRPASTIMHFIIRY